MMVWDRIEDDESHLLGTRHNAFAILHEALENGVSRSLDARNLQNFYALSFDFQ